MKSLLKTQVMLLLISGIICCTSCKKYPPDVITTDVSDITPTSAKSGGEVTDNGGSEVTARGVCWDITPNPTVNSKITSNGKGNGIFSSDLTGLITNTTYYIRAYAVNDVETSYGNQVSFITLCQSASSTTHEPSDIGANNATLRGTVNANGSPTTVSFEYGTTTSYGSTVTATPATVTGSSNTSVSANITGLAPGQTYHYRIKTVNCGGTFDGQDQTFITGCTTPSATSSPADPLGTTTATLKGTVNANGSPTTVSFEYGTTTSYGSTATGTPATATGSSNTSVSANITGLTPGQTYHYRVKAVNCGGTTYGSDLTLTTGCTKPSATTNPADPVGTSTATLKGTVNANNSSTTVTFEYGATTSYGSEITATPSLATGSSNTAVNASISGLTPGQTYHYRVKAVNCGGTTYGSDLTLTTGCTKPSATTNPADPVGTSTATLSGNVNANNSSTTVTFEYGTTTSYGSEITATPSLATGSSNTAVNASISGLTPGQTYHYRVKAVNCGGTTYGSDLTLTTGCTKPSATTNPADPVGTTTATLKGTVNAYNSSTTVTFEYGTTTSYGSEITATPSPVTGSSNTAVSASISGLNSGQTYHYRVKAVNCGGTTYGSDLTLTTGCTKPSATTNPADPVGTTTATLKGTINANNSSTTVTFEYGTTTSYGSMITATPSPVTGSSNTAVSASISGLTSGQTYHYRVKAVNCGGTTYGSDLTLTTGCTKPSATTNPADPVGTTTATLKGTVNAYNSSTTVTFEYGTTTSYGSMITATPSPVTGSSNTVVSVNITSLSSNTIYHYRVRAVNCGGTTYGSDVEFRTTCPTVLTVTHTVGAIAPITKTVTYGIVQTNLSGSFKCWITKNLGADIQATILNDTSEPAGGWYWQFNRRQGFKHDGNNRTPNTTWITSINETSDWTSANDPCRQLLGIGWRIPSATEWTSVISNGNWVTPTDAYASVLRIHPAGSLTFVTNGGLINRGWVGNYWTNNQHDETRSYAFNFYQSSISGYMSSKTMAHTIRCIRD